MRLAGNILVPTDFSHASELAVEAAALLAKQFGGAITLVHVHDPAALRSPATIGFRPEQQDAIVAQVESSIEQSFAELATTRLAGVQIADKVILRDTSAAHAICSYAQTTNADLIVIATHGRTGLAHLLIGSVAERVVRHAPCPVLTLRSRAKE